jgi:hydroxymethylpyrimidine/phosphomethylpyrimidine kinase
VPESRGRVLVIAGSDSGGGAGVQADIKTITMLGGYGATAITAITVQNTLGVHRVHPLSIDLIEAQARAVLDDIGADAIKIGMLGGADVAAMVARLLGDYPGIPVVLDPVMTAKGGHTLLPSEGVEVLRAHLIPRAALLTPNAPEAAALTGLAVRTTEDLSRAGAALLRLGAAAVLMKGGHIDGDIVVDLLITPAYESRFKSPRVDSRHTHGTGCTLASACAAGIAQGLALADAVTRAHAYTSEAIRRAPGFGAGHGPLDHAWPMRSGS